jgi:hypothetical protein
MRRAEDYSTGKLTTACGNQCDRTHTANDIKQVAAKLRV